MTTCMVCGRAKADPAYESIIGRDRCAACASREDSLTAAVVVSDGSIGEAVAVQGWLSRLRAARKERG